MPNDQKRLDQVFRHIQRIKSSDYAVIVGNETSYRIVERPWRDLPESSKLAILQDAVDWSGITNRDQATILLSEIDPGKITDAQRSRLIEAAAQSSYEDELLRDLRELTSRQFIYEDPWHGFVPSDGAPTEYQIGQPLPFTELGRWDKVDVIDSFIHWSDFREKGLYWRDQNAIENNVIEGKPPHKWLEGTSLLDPSLRAERREKLPGRLGDESAGHRVEAAASPGKEQAISPAPVHFRGFTCELHWKTYPDGRPALYLIDANTRETVAVATAALPYAPLKPGEVFIKDHSENRGMLAALEKAGIVQATGETVRSGFVEVPVAKVLSPSHRRERQDDRDKVRTDESVMEKKSTNQMAGMSDAYKQMLRESAASVVPERDKDKGIER